MGDNPINERSEDNAIQITDSISWCIIGRFDTVAIDYGLRDESLGCCGESIAMTLDRSE